MCRFHNILSMLPLKKYLQKEKLEKYQVLRRHEMRLSGNTWWRWTIQRLGVQQLITEGFLIWTLDMSHSVFPSPVKVDDKFLKMPSFLEWVFCSFLCGLKSTCDTTRLWPEKNVCCRAVREELALTKMHGRLLGFILNREKEVYWRQVYCSYCALFICDFCRRSSLFCSDIFKCVF